MPEMKEYILALDQSTSGTKAILIDRAGAVACRSDLAHRQIVTPEGWAEHDPMEIWANVPGRLAPCHGAQRRRARADKGHSYSKPTRDGGLLAAGARACPCITP